MSTTSALRIIFAGTPDFAATHLQGLLDCGRHQVVAVYSQPDRPAGRGKKLTASPVKAIALQHGIDVYQPTSLKDPQAQAEFRALNADIMVVVAYGLILPPEILNAPPLGCINVHASLLPRWRGAAPIQRAIQAGDTETGVVIMQMDEGLDTGAMLLTARCPISTDDTGGSLHDKLAALGVTSLNEALDQIASGTTEPIFQDDRLSCYANKINKQDAIIQWQESACSIERQVRAFNPFPVAYTQLAGERIKVWQAKANPLSDAGAATPGTITNADKNGIVVACGEGSLTLTRLQLAGKKALDVADLLNAKADLFCVGAHFDTLNTDKLVTAS